MDGLFMDPEAFGHSLMGLPSEILAHCLVWLPLLDRISVSQVSRFWRSVSLAHPTIWANIDLEGQLDILGMVLSRSGTCPVSLTGFCDYDPDHIVSQCLREHLHHVRSIFMMDLPEDALPLHTPAPLLEEIVSTSYHIDIPVDFLGGQPARLQTLELSSVSLPADCIVLSTVTTLILDYPYRHDEAVAYGRLFKLFPRLIALTLYGLAWEFRDMLPREPAPASLRKLVLSTGDERYDLIGTHFEDWRTKSLRDVDLEQESLMPTSLARLVAGSTKLRVSGHHKRDTTQLTVRDAAGCTCAVSFSQTAEDRANVADMLLVHAQDAVRALVHIEIPLAALSAFLPVLAALPELARLGLWIPIGDHNCVAHRIPLELVPDILRVKARCADSLRAIILHVMCPVVRCPPTPRDARLLSNRILALGKRGRLPRELIVKGYTYETFDSTVYFDQQKDCVFELSFQCQ